jgi:hypothetical protein
MNVTDEQVRIRQDIFEATIPLFTGRLQDSQPPDQELPEYKARVLNVQWPHLVSFV